MPRDYLNYITPPNDDRLLKTEFDEKTGRPIEVAVPVVVAAPEVEKVDGQDEKPVADDKAK